MNTQLNTERIARQPVWQAVIIFAFVLLIALVDRMFQSGDKVVQLGNTTWILLTASILFYAICSSVLSLRSPDMNRYWRDSILAFVGLTVLSAVAATVISGVGIDEAGSFRWIFVVLAIGFLVFLSIVRVMKRIVDIAIKQDERLRGGE